MKTILQLLIYVISLNSLYAQSPVIDKQNYFQTGHEYVYRVNIITDTIQQHQSPGSAGANQIWNFPWLTFQQNYFCQDTLMCVNPVSTIYYPVSAVSGNDTANICLLNKSDHYTRNSDHQYYLDKNNLISKAGNNNDNGVTEEVNFSYQNLRTEFYFPASCPSSLIDSFQMTYFDYLSGYHFVDGSDSIIADGYGTLIIDGTTYENCVRIKDIFHSENNNSILGTYVREQTNYTWFCKEKEGPVLIMEVTNDEFTGVPKIRSASYFLPNTYVVTKVDEQNVKQNVSVYPNPAKTEITIDFPFNPDTEIEIINAKGQLILQTKNTSVINIEKLAKGIYFVSLKQDEKFYLGKFVKQ